MKPFAVILLTTLRVVYFDNLNDVKNLCADLRAEDVPYFVMKHLPVAGIWIKMDEPVPVRMV